MGESLKSKNPPAVLANPDLHSKAELDIEDLRKQMLRGIYEIERFLYAQAVHETEAMTRTREIIKTLEDDLFDQKNWQFLSAKSKIELYRTLTGNVQSNLKFIQTLHGEVATALDTLKSLGRETTAGGAREKTPDENQKLKVMKSLILQKVKEKTLANRKSK